MEYTQSKPWIEFFGHVADQIVQTLHPKSVLDVGCAMGYLVAALRDRGVEAYGIDVSAYAVSKVREDIRPYCRAVSALNPLPEEFPKKFDLVTNIEVAEHIYKEDVDGYFSRLCSYADDILFSSTPDDVTEKTHFNVQQAEYWAKLFAGYGFFKVLDYDASYLSPQATRFAKREISVSDLVENYEREIRIYRENVQASLEEKTQFADQMKSNCDILQKENQTLVQKNIELEMKEMSAANENVFLSKTIEMLREENAQLEKNVLEYDIQYNATVNSSVWKLTKPLRAMLNGIKKLLNSTRPTKIFYKGLASVKNYGIRATWQKVSSRRYRIKHEKDFMKRYVFTQEERQMQEAAVFDRDITFSILVPLYNTPEKFLAEMIDSVLAQTYPKWELCLADGSDESHAYVGEICRRYAQKDPRVRYQVLTENLGISGNTNKCIEMATGDYIGLFDHDDLLHPAALYEAMKAITEKDADFIYTDEMTFSHDIQNPVTTHFKPDFALDNLRANNYICHFSVFSRALLDQVGYFSGDYDGSQDFDIILRLTQKAKHVVHIPKILYFWRSHAGSTAGNISVKPYCITSGIQALNDYLKRMGIEGTAMEAPNAPMIYRIKYTLKDTPLVSIIIPNKDHIDDLNRCICSIYQKSTYRNFEIIVVENNSKIKKTFEYYELLKNRPDLRVIQWENPFHLSAVQNFAASQAKGKYLLFLDNDTEVISPRWMEEMLMYAQGDDVGAVGAKLYFPDNTIEHAGIVIGIQGSVGHAHYRAARGNLGYMGRLMYAQNFSAVSGACMMISKEKFDQAGGFCEDYAFAFNDVDLCLRLREQNYLIVFTPYAELYHYESKTKGKGEASIKNSTRFKEDETRFQTKWKAFIEKGDPYYNPNFSLERDDFTL